MMSLTQSDTHVSRNMEWYASEDLSGCLGEELEEVLVNGEIGSAVLHNEAGLGHVKGVQDEIDGTAQKELLGKGNLLELL